MHKKKNRLIYIIKKYFSSVCLIISSLILFYIFYKSEIYWKGNLRSYYFFYYLISTILIIFSIITFFINDKVKVYLIISLTGFVFLVYIFEGYLVYKNGSKNNLISKKNKYDFYFQLKKSNENIAIDVDPSNFLNNQDYKIYPLSGISGVLTIDCPGQTIWKSDKHGFNNDDNDWNERVIEYLIIGDSIAQGECVDRPDNIASMLKIFSKKKTLNLGYDGNGPLLEFATLREYLKPNVKNVIWLYNEKNDIDQLKNEIKNKILIKYLKNLNFTQQLNLKQDQVDYTVNFHLEQNVRKYSKIKEIKKGYNLTNNLIKFLKVFKIRYLIYSYLKQKNNKIPIEFREILKNANILARQNNSNFYFIYLPEVRRYNSLVYVDNFNKIKLIVEDLKIPLIDIKQEVFEKEKNPLNLFPEKLPGNYNVKGYKKIAEVIYNITKR
tara:strand:- start:1463 stop:2776 length:1314 start_codon:yes stop_codon:yes gene_type:complete